MGEMLLTSNLFEGSELVQGWDGRQGCCLVRLGLGLIGPNAGQTAQTRELELELELGARQD